MSQKRPRKARSKRGKLFTGKSAMAGVEGSKRQPGGPRIPAIAMVPVGLAVGWIVANWPGAIFGGIIGVFLWRSRA